MEIIHYTEFPEELKEQWNNLLEGSITNVPFLRFEYQSDWWSTRGGGEWPKQAELALLAGFEDGKLVGIAPFFTAEHEGQQKLLLVGCVEISDYLDLIVTLDKLTEFTNALLDYLKNNLMPKAGIKTAELFNVLEGSPSQNIIEQSARSAGFTFNRERLQQAPAISLPGDWEAYLESIDKKQRHEIRRKMRRAVESQIPVELYFTTTADKLEADMEAFLALMAEDPEKQNFLTDLMRQEFKLIMRQGFIDNTLQLAFLKVGEEYAAAYLNMDYNNRIWVYNSGLDRLFMEFSPGWVLLGYLLQWANENKRAVFDFMRGSEDYKYKFGGVDRFVTRLTLSL